MSSPLVMDASVAASWALPDEVSLITAESASRRLILVPPLWQFELCNALLMAERRGRILSAQVTSFLEFVALIPAEVDVRADSGMILDLARRNTLTVYDAAYLELALRRNAALATLDRRLAAAAVAEGVPLAAAE